MPICPNCPPLEKPIIKEVYLLPDPRKHCQVCGDCMKGYLIAPSYFPSPVLFARREYYFCSHKCKNSFWLHHYGH